MCPERSGSAVRSVALFGRHGAALFGRRLHWVDIRQYFRDPATRDTPKVVFKKTLDRFDASTRSRLFGIARPRDSGLYLAPLPKNELLLPNLLRASFPTKQVCFADTTYRDPQDLLAAFQRTNAFPDAGWVLHGGQVISFQPLTEPPWPAVCDTACILLRPTSSLTESEDLDEKRLFVRLLTRCLERKCRDQGIRFDNRKGVFYFAATDSLKRKRIAFKSTARQSSRTVFEAYRDKQTGQVRFCRHSAFEGHFRRLGTDWYLEVTPTYVFTRDGRLPDRFAEERLKGIKRLERHRAVLGHLLTWIDLLTQPADIFHGTHPHLTFERPASLPLGVGIDDAGWFGNEDPEEAARLDREEAATGLLFNP